MNPCTKSHSSSSYMYSRNSFSKRAGLFLQTIRRQTFVLFFTYKSKPTMVECSALAYAVEDTGVTVRCVIFMISYVKFMHACVWWALQGATCAEVTFRVVVEDTVVGTVVGVWIPEGGCTEAEGRRLHPLLRQSLLQPSPQSLHEPVNTHRSTVSYTVPPFQFESRSLNLRLKRRTR